MVSSQLLIIQCISSYDYWFIYLDLYKEFELSPEQEKSCVPTKESVTIKSIKTDKCIIIYDDSSCKSISNVRVDNDTQSDIITVKSFHVCSQELGGGSLLDVDFASLADETGYFLEYRDVCGCKNIPASSRKVVDDNYVYFHNHGNGFAVFEKENCEPPYFYFRPGNFLLIDQSIKPELRI